MASVLWITADIPYFPGKNGHDFFNLRQLVKTHKVSVVGPNYPQLPAEGVANLRATAHACYFWPEPVGPCVIASEVPPRGELRSWFRFVPKALLTLAWTKLSGNWRKPPDALYQLTLLANLAPYILQAVRAERPTGVILVQSSTEPWLGYLPRFLAKVLYFHDVRTDFYRKQRDILPEKQARHRLRAYVRQEQRILDQVELAAFVSERDRDIINRDFECRKAALAVAPIPVDLEYYSVPKRRIQRPPIVLFTGHLRHPPNVDAVLYFAETIWPQVLKRCPDAVFKFAGCFPDPSLRDLGRSGRRVECHPDVPDIRPFFAEASVYVVPMRFGGGVRQKIFEAWSMRVPVVVSSMGAEGSGALPGENCLVADEPEEFAERIVELISDPELAGRLTATGSRFVREHHAVEVAAQAFTSTVSRALAIKRAQPFRMLYDVRWMHPGSAGGIEQLVYELVAHLSKLDSQNFYRFFGPRSALLDWKFPAFFKRRLFFSDLASLQARQFVDGVIDEFAFRTTGTRFLNREMRLLRFVKKMDFDLVHSFQGFTYPEFEGFPSIVSVPDLQHLAHPEFFSKEDWHVRDRLLRPSLMRASHIICISQFTLESVHRHYQIPRDKMTVIWIAPSRAASLPLSDAERVRLLKSLGIQLPFVLFPAHNWPHKNHNRLLEAFALARAQLPKGLKLILTGGTAHPAVNLKDLIAEHGLNESVRHLGYVTPLELRALYGSAVALIFPSLFEGFGMPIAEAIVSGCPVACADSASLPEIAGDAALTFDPYSVSDIAEALIRITTEKDLREQLLARGRKRKALFSPWIPAIKTLQVYRQTFDELYA